MVAKEHLVVQTDLVGDALAGFRMMGKNVKDFAKVATKSFKEVEEKAKASSKVVNKAFEKLAVDSIVNMARSVPQQFQAIVRASSQASMSMIEAASKAEEAKAKFDTVFEGMEDQANSTALEIADAFGRNVGDIQNAMSGLQDLFVPLGLAEEGAAELSTEMTKLALDLASFNNQLDSEAINAISSAMVGSHETVKRYGVILNETTIGQEAMNMGLGKTYSQLTEQEKVLVRARILFRDTRKAQGDVARTSDSWANSTKRLKAQIESVREEIGADLRDAILQMIEDIGGTETVVGAVNIAFTAMAETFKTLVLPVVKSLFKSFREFIDHSGGVEVAVLNIRIRFLEARTAYREFVDALKEMTGVGGVWKDIADSIGETVDSMFLYDELADSYNRNVKIIGLSQENLDETFRRSAETLSGTILKAGELGVAYEEAMRKVQEASVVRFDETSPAEALEKWQLAYDELQALRSAALRQAEEALKADQVVGDPAVFEALRNNIKLAEDAYASALSGFQKMKEGMDPALLELIEARQQLIALKAAAEGSSAALDGTGDALESTGQGLEQLALDAGQASGTLGSGSAPGEYTPGTGILGAAGAVGMISVGAKQSQEALAQLAVSMALAGGESAMKFLAAMSKVAQESAKIGAQIASGLAGPLFGGTGGEEPEAGPKEPGVLAGGLTAGVVAATNSFDSFFESIYDGTKSSSEAFKDLKTVFLREASAMIAKALILRMLGVNFAGTETTGGGLFGAMGVSFGGEANGGITNGVSMMANGGVLPFKSFASGGTINKPTLALMGENPFYKGEAFVPLPDGKKIPVEGAGGPTVVFEVNALDSRSFDERLVERRDTLIGLIREATIRDRGFRNTVGAAR